MLNSQFLCNWSKISTVDSPMSHTSCCKTVLFVFALFIFELNLYLKQEFYFYSRHKSCALLFADLNELSDFEWFPI